MQFYIYTYFIDGVPEYVGKGTNNPSEKGTPRCLRHARTTAKRAKHVHWRNHLQSSIRKQRDVRIVIDFVTANELEALVEEQRRIKKYGRRDLGTGTLYNLTDGGEGASGAKRSAEWRLKQSLANKGQKRSEEARAKMRGPRDTPQWVDPAARAEKIRLAKLAYWAKRRAQQ